MKRRSLVSILIVLNAALVLVLMVFTLSATATARQNGLRPRGAYQMVAGKMSGSSTSPVYVVDSVNQELISLTWNRNINRFDLFAYRNVGADAQEARGNR